MANLSPLHNGGAIERAARTVGLPLWVAAALAEVESNGRNVFGHDVGGALHGAGEVTEEKFRRFYQLITSGHKSNGVGPVQITYKGYFTQDPHRAWWDPEKSCEVGFRIIKGHLNGDYSGGSIQRAGSLYNAGNPTGAYHTYGKKLRDAANRWLARLQEEEDEVGFTPNRAVTDVQLTPNISAGRPAGPPNEIIIHHWGSDGQSHQRVVDYLCNPDNHGASAHYVASAGRVTQLASEHDRTWHAGRSGNPRGIGIECRPEMSAGDIATVQDLVNAIHEEHGPLPVRGHRDHMATACPGRWYSILGALQNGTAAAPPKPRVKQSDYTIQTGYGTLIVSGQWDEGTEKRHKRVWQGWDAPFAISVRNMQRWLNQTVGEGHIRNLIGKPRLEEDGLWPSGKTETTKVLQFLLWNRVPGLAKGETVWRDHVEGGNSVPLSEFCDGWWGSGTCAVYQTALNRSWGDSGKLFSK